MSPGDKVIGCMVSSQNMNFALLYMPSIMFVPSLVVVPVNAASLPHFSKKSACDETSTFRCLNPCEPIKSGCSDMEGDEPGVGCREKKDEERRLFAGVVMITSYISLNMLKSVFTELQFSDYLTVTPQEDLPVGKKMSKYPCLTKKVSQGIMLPPYLVCTTGPFLPATASGSASKSLIKSL